MDHPQLWLIPPAVSVLAAGQILKDRINQPQLAALRYASAALLYVSSTSEIFIRGVGESLWPPMILATLAVIGLFAGTILRIRAFLFLGCLFLLVAMITMVAHAGRQLNHVWPWWAFGVGMGILILVVFGLFEKRRNEMKSYVGKLQEWDW
jgi:hypothetical protein